MSCQTLKENHRQPDPPGSVLVRVNIGGLCLGAYRGPTTDAETGSESGNLSLETSTLMTVIEVKEVHNKVRTYGLLGTFTTNSV